MVLQGLEWAFSLKFRLFKLGVIIHANCVANKKNRVTSIRLKRTFRLQIAF